jgi:hypothetical protein
MGGAGGWGETTTTGPVFQCGMDQSASVVTSTSSSSTGGFETAPHLPLPQATKGSTPVLAHLELVTITFDGDANRTDEEAFGDIAVTSNWLSSAGADYGVGTGTHLAKVSFPATLPAQPMDSDIRTFLSTHIADGTLPSPASPNQEVLYLLYVPDVTLACPLICGGYHDRAKITLPSGMETVDYAVVQNTMWPFDETTSIASHEIIEAATDPSVGGGYLLRGATDTCDVVTNDFARLTNGFGTQEVGDLCEELQQKNVTEGSFAFQRAWSNSAGSTGDPCVPLPPGSVYANVSPIPSKTQSVPRGGSIQFQLTGWSTAATPDWKLTTEVLGSPSFDAAPKLSQPTINNGNVVTLTLSVPQSAQPGDVSTIVIVSTQADGTKAKWPVAVEAE